jgi:hypothetical protein
MRAELRPRRRLASLLPACTAFTVAASEVRA